MNNLREISIWLQERCGGGGAIEFYEALVLAGMIHSKKNTGYRSTANPFANFYESAPVVKRINTPVQYAMILCAKQDDAVYPLLFNEGTKDFEARGGLAMLEERLYDGLVYRGIMLAMLRRDFIGQANGKECRIEGSEDRTDRGSSR